jgi:hypothetical protein
MDGWMMRRMDGKDDHQGYYISRCTTIGLFVKLGKHNTKTLSLSLGHTQGEIFEKKKPANKYISIHWGETPKEPSILVVVGLKLSFILSFIFLECLRCC